MKKKKNRAPKQCKFNSIVRCFVKPFKADPSCGFIWDAEMTHSLDVRGWGFLTGGGALGLDEDYAMRVQDAFQQHVVDALNAYKEFVPPNDKMRRGETNETEVKE